MAKVVVADLNGKPRDVGRKRPSVTEKRVRDRTGHVETVRTLDVLSETFDDDFLYVFAKNVARARRENKRLLGSADIVPPKR